MGGEKLLFRGSSTIDIYSW